MYYVYYVLCSYSLLYMPCFHWQEVVSSHWVLIMMQEHHIGGSISVSFVSSSCHDCCMQVKIAELPVDMFRMMQTLEWSSPCLELQGRDEDGGGMAQLVSGELE